MHRTSKAALTLAAALTLTLTHAASAQTIVNLGTLNSTTGNNARAPLVIDANGNLLGTASSGGTNGRGTVFELTNTGSGYAAPTAIANFGGSLGQTPSAGLTIGSTGTLFGTTQDGISGVSNSRATIFSLTPNGSGGYNAASTITNYIGTSGGDILRSPVTIDAAGNLITGFANDGPNGYGGGISEVKRNADGTYQSPVMLYNTNNSTGDRVNGRIAIAADGSLVYTVTNDGAAGGGVLLTTVSNGVYSTGTPTILGNFSPASSYGNTPSGGVVIDANGNIFGTTSAGGANGYGTVFEIPKTANGYGSMITMGAFDNTTTGGTSTSSLLLDANGDIFGTTSTGGANGYGTVFEIARISPYAFGGITALGSFTSAQGGSYGGLIADSAGNLFGTTQNSVFEVTNAGFALVGDPTLVPEPASMALFGVALAGLAAGRRRRKA